MRTIAIAAALALVAIEAGAFTIDAQTYFAYVEIPRPSRRHLQEYVLLSHKKCTAKGAPAGAKQATYLVAGRESPGCWMKFRQAPECDRPISAGAKPAVGTIAMTNRRIA
jgi:hypothetical protein